MTHLRRAKGVNGSAVHFTADMVLRSTKQQFLANAENKQRFISALGSSLAATCIVIHAQADADLQIVLTATKCADSKRTAVVGEDTDLLILLAYHASAKAHDMFLFSDKTGKKQRIWPIKQVIAALGDLRYLLLFLHAMTGSDTTSRPYGIGKTAALRKLRSCKELQDLATVFYQAHSKTFESIESAGEKSLVLLYGGTLNESLDGLRYRLFCSKVAIGTTFVQVHTLPPTSAAARFHSCRVYLQVQEWMGNTPAKDATNFGWKLEHGRLAPVTTDQPAAPADLLKIIRCTCRSNCDTKRCSCRKHGLQCSSGCGECCGVSCSNSTLLSTDLD